MTSWSDVEVISIGSDSEGPDSESIDDPVEEEIFSQVQGEDELFDVDDAEETLIEHVCEDQPETEVETQLEVLLSQPSHGAGPSSPSSKRKGGKELPHNRVFGSRSSAIDLTASADGYGSPQPRGRVSSSRPVADAPVLGFQEEYEELMECTVDDVSGVGFPCEGVAELLLRHPEHWWCR